MNIKPSRTCCVWKETVDLSKNKDLQINVEEGCIAYAVCETTGKNYPLDPGQYPGVYGIFTNGYKPTFKLFGKPDPIILTVYCANASLEENWGVSDIPYIEEDGTDSIVGCNGRITLTISDLECAYKKLSSISNSKSENTPIKSEDFWELIHGKLDEIIRNQLNNYFKQSIKRDGFDFAPYKQAIIDSFYKEFIKYGIELQNIIVANLNNPHRVSGKAVTAENKSVSQKDEEVLQAAKEREEKERKAKEEARINAEVDARVKAAEEARIKAEAEAKARAEAEAKARAEMEARIKAEVEARIKAEREKQQREDAKAKAEAKLRADEEARIRAEVEAKVRAEAEAKIKAEAEARIKAEAEARAKAEMEAKIRAEVEAEMKAKEKGKKIRCSRCGSEIAGDHRYCPRCGNFLG